MVPRASGVIAFHVIYRYFLHACDSSSVSGKELGCTHCIASPFLIQTNLLARVHFASIMKCCDLATSGHNSGQNNGMVDEHNFRVIDSGALHMLVIAIHFYFPSVARPR